MKKLILIGLKDVKLIFRDRAALTFMLLAPFLLTIGLGFVTGQMGRSSTSGLAAIPVLVVNQDDGQLGQALADLLRSEDLAGLLLPTLAADATAARGQVDADQAAAAVIVPAGFSDSIIPRSGQTPSGQAVKIEVYKNPGRPVSAGVIQAIVEGFISRVETGRVAGQVIVVQALTAGLIAPDQAQDFAVAVGQRQTAASAAEPLIRLQFSASGEEQQPFNPMAYMAPSMALLFLMFTVTNGGRSLLAEKAQGTLARLLEDTAAAEREAGRGVRRVGVGHAHHRAGADAGPGFRRRHGCHAHLRHPGRQLRADQHHAIVVPMAQQGHAQRLGAGWLHHPGPGRHPGRSGPAPAGAAGDGPRPGRRGHRPVQPPLAAASLR